MTVLVICWYKIAVLLCLYMKEKLHVYMENENIIFYIMVERTERVGLCSSRGLQVK